MLSVHQPLNRTVVPSILLHVGASLSSYPVKTAGIDS